MSDFGEIENERHETQRPLRFTIADMLRVTALCCGVLGLVQWLGPWGWLPGSALIIGYIVLRLGIPGGIQMYFDGLLLISSIVVLLALLLPAVETSSRIPSRRSICASNLKQIAWALHVYHEKHGSFPPAYFVDSQGRLTHSWRAMILTELGRPDLAAAYRWDEPWDGPNNRRLHSEGFHILRCPSDTNNPPHGTSYVAVVGPGTMFPGQISVKVRQVTDKPDETIHLVEIHNGGIGWFEPRDLHVTQMAPAINTKQGQGPSSSHPGGVNVAFADVSVRFLTDDLPPRQFRAMLTIAGGETVKVP